MDDRNRPTEPLAVDVVGAGRLLGMSAEGFRAFARRHSVPRVKLGRAVRYRVADLERLLAERVAIPATADSVERPRGSRGRFVEAQS